MAIHIHYIPIRRRTWDCVWQRIIITRPIDDIPTITSVVRLREIWVNEHYDVLVDELDYEFWQW